MKPPVWLEQLGTVTQERVREAAQAFQASNQLPNVARLLTHRPRNLKTHTRSTGQGPLPALEGPLRTSEGSTVDFREVGTPCAEDN